MMIVDDPWTYHVGDLVTDREAYCVGVVVRNDESRLGVVSVVWVRWAPPLPGGPHTRGFHDLEARFRGRAQRVWNSSVRRLTPEESLAVAVDREATPDFVHVTHE